jgi:uncharacterized surface protein with fasciclin (FAS1) repeats
MKKRHLLPAICLSAAALFVAGCGGDDDTESTAASTPAATVAPADIVATASGAENLSTLVAAVKAADLVETLQGTGPFTVFAPTNDAFAEIQSTVDTLLKPENKADLAGVLTYHVVAGDVAAADLKDGQELTTVQGEKLTVSIDGDTVKVGDATVTTPDVKTSNGVVHIIDKVLVPPTK